VIHQLVEDLFLIFSNFDSGVGFRCSSVHVWTRAQQAIIEVFRFELIKRKFMTSNQSQESSLDLNLPAEGGKEALDVSDTNPCHEILSFI